MQQLDDTTPTFGRQAPPSRPNSTVGPNSGTPSDQSYTAETLINKALAADTRPNTVARSDDAPYIWAEINKLSTQFGRLEKQVEQSSNDIQGHHQTLIAVRVDTQALCSRNEQAKGDLERATAVITETLKAIVIGAESRLDSKINTMGITVESMATDLKSTAGDVSVLKTEQESTLKLVKVLSPLILKIAAGILGVVGLSFGGAVWFWTSSMRPALVEDIADSAQKKVEAQLEIKATRQENERLKAENAALLKGKKL